MFDKVCSFWKYLYLLLPLILLCGCGTPGTAQVSPTPTPDTQTGFASYVGKWEVHDALLSINADHTGLEQWNAGPCNGQLCGGNAQITFSVNADGSIKGTTQSVSYSQSSGSPVPTGFQPDPTSLQAGDAFQLQHSGAHLLYTTWLSSRQSSLNNQNRYWCDTYALSGGWQQCGA